MNPSRTVPVLECIASRDSVAPLVVVLVAQVVSLSRCLQVLELQRDSHLGGGRRWMFNHHGVQVVDTLESLCRFRGGRKDWHWFRAAPAVLPARFRPDPEPPYKLHGSGRDFTGPDLHAPWCPVAGFPLAETFDPGPGGKPGTCGICHATRGWGGRDAAGSPSPEDAGMAAEVAYGWPELQSLVP